MPPAQTLPLQQVGYRNAITGPLSLHLLHKVNINIFEAKWPWKWQAWQPRVSIASRGSRNRNSLHISVYYVIFGLDNTKFTLNLSWPRTRDICWAKPCRSESSIWFTFGCIVLKLLWSGIFHFNNLLHECKQYHVGFLQADVDGDGSIDYIEFITATMHLNRVEREDHLFKAFEYFDKDKSGFVSLSSIYCTRNMSSVDTSTHACIFCYLP